MLVHPRDPRKPRNPDIRGQERAANCKAETEKKNAGVLTFQVAWKQRYHQDKRSGKEDFKKNKDEVEEITSKMTEIKR